MGLVTEMSKEALTVVTLKFSESLKQGLERRRESGDRVARVVDSTWQWKRGKREPCGIFPIASLAIKYTRKNLSISFIKQIVLIG